MCVLVASRSLLCPLCWPPAAIASRSLSLSPCSSRRLSLLVTLFSVSVFLVWQPPRRDVLHSREREKENSGNVAWLARSHVRSFTSSSLRYVVVVVLVAAHPASPLSAFSHSSSAVSRVSLSSFNPPTLRNTIGRAHTHATGGRHSVHGTYAHRQSHALGVCTSRAHSAPRCPTIRERFSNCPKLLGYNSSSYRRADNPSRNQTTRDPTSFQSVQFRVTNLRA